MMIVGNITNNKILAVDARIADTFFNRLKGLLGSKNLDQGQGLIIRPCNSIHTIGMKYDIDVIFIDERDYVVKISKAIRAGRFAVCQKSAYVLELPAGTISRTGTKVGDKISISDNPNSKI